MRNSSHREVRPPGRPDVIVLGAGAAGLACAAALARAGLRPIVLEARPRMGGRVHTLHERGASLPVELGAEFVHGRAPELVAIARAAGLALCDASGDSRSRSARGLAPGAGLDETLAATLGRMRVGRDTSVTKALAGTRASRAARAAAAAFVQGFDAAPPDETSAKWIVRSQANAIDEATHVMRFADGYDGVIDCLRRAAAGESNDVIRTCVVATRVDWRPGRVRVTCASPSGSSLDTLEAEKLVVTLPVGVLQAAPDSPGAVGFDPPLPPEHERALRRLAMGHVFKLTLRFRRPLWPRTMAFLQDPAQPVPTFWTVRPLDDPRVVAWCGGHLAQALLAHEEPRILDLALASLSAALGTSRRRVERELAGWWMHDWSADPFARGGYAFARVGGSLAWRALAAPIAGTLFLAGEATCDASSAGTVHGAIASGRRAARRILAARAS